MRVILLSTDPSCLKLVSAIQPPHQVVALIVPSNRLDSDKTRQLVSQSNYPVHFHARGKAFEADVPEADIGVSWLYSQIILASDLDRFHLSVLNMHGGKIPEYRGANVLNWAIANGERDIGVTWHKLVEAVDAGPIVAEGTICVGDDVTALEARSRMIAEGIRLFPEAWRRVIEGLPPTRIPDLERGRLWPPRRPHHGRIQPDWPENKVRAIIRAQCDPWPAATVEHGGNDVPVREVHDTPAPGRMPYRTAEGRVLFLASAGTTKC